MSALKRALWWPTALALLGGAAGGAHLGHRAADAARHEVGVDMDLLFLPDGRTLQVASLGFHEPVANFLWIRAVLLFGDRFGRDPSTEWGPWMNGMIRAINHLDPDWRTPYFYGGMFLRVIEDIEGSDAVFAAGAAAFPRDAFFPFALGMNAYLYRKDVEAAARWVGEASNRPNAPAWYAAAAAGFLAEQNQRATAIRFLRDERATTTDPAVREALDTKLAELTHDELAEALDAARTRYQSTFGTDVGDVVELERLGQPLPPDPLGGAWILAPDGHIRSSVREEKEVRSARSQERVWLLR